MGDYREVRRPGGWGKQRARQLKSKNAEKKGKKRGGENTELGEQ